MILNYIKQPECLILAVSPANQDLATSDALEIARQVDPQRLRTIGVLTKLDLMDEGTNARDILENRQVTLKRGWVGVLNRSQSDIENGRDVQHILDKEKNFFLSKPYYRHLSDKMGTPFLRRMLQRTLRSHIKAALPQVRTRWKAVLHGQVGEQVHQRHRVETDGSVRTDRYEAVVCGAYINYKLNTEVQSNLRLNLVPDDEEMTVLITNLNGLRGSISFPSLALDCVNRKLIAQFEYPLEKCVDCIHEILQEAVNESAALLNRYPATKAEVLFRIDRSLKKEAELTLQKLRDHVQAEMFYVNLEHPDLDLSVKSDDPVVPAVGPTKKFGKHVLLRPRNSSSQQRH
ncbi:dynamin [Caerostris darwini]|uniref:Dynamin n=1 Tax=Caerostris darwini TaxID=1538125 RepID=A0AAV4U1R1_9ARAC|nr:dynamin [Caerostris darwini]